MNTTNTQTQNKTQPKVIGNHYVNLGIGIIGMTIACLGNLTHDLNIQKWCYLLGAMFLFTSSALERQKFYIALQIIIGTGAAIAFSHLGVWEKASVPIILSIFTIIYFIVTKQLKDPLTAFGCLGIVILAAGYAVTNPLIFFTGSLVLMVYSFISYRRGVTIALLWAILNAVFVATASLAVYRML